MNKIIQQQLLFLRAFAQTRQKLLDIYKTIMVFKQPFPCSELSNRLQKIYEPLSKEKVSEELVGTANYLKSIMRETRCLTAIMKTHKALENEMIMESLFPLSRLKKRINEWRQSVCKNESKVKMIPLLKFLENYHLLLTSKI